MEGDQICTLDYIKEIFQLTSVITKSDVFLSLLNLKQFLTRFLRGHRPACSHDWPSSSWFTGVMPSLLDENLVCTRVCVRVCALDRFFDHSSPQLLRVSFWTGSWLVLQGWLGSELPISLPASSSGVTAALVCAHLTLPIDLSPQTSTPDIFNKTKTQRIGHYKIWKGSLASQKKNWTI